MAALKGGRVADFTNSMAESMETAMNEEWMARTGSHLPDEGRDDRRLLLAAIARGMLAYLKANETALVSAIAIDLGTGPVARPVTEVDLNYVGD
ncbi:MAG: hypothetical protein OEY13_14475 [Gammaproteobacteria bacterium]|nr:hypothetical protein [Gammaproteobacteria bacterium]MDH4311667.1 hypothetical protein [Gammaproteobacteria bacterium]MDH5274268.1 hypothetical protein [Gammaproteobacteria bacterium]